MKHGLPWEYYMGLPLGILHGMNFQALESRKRHVLYSKTPLCPWVKLHHRRDLFTVTKVFMKRATKSTNNLGNRDALFEGIMPAEKDLRSGGFANYRQ